MSATGVRFRRLVTSPMAQMLGTLVRLKRSTLIAPVFSSSSTPTCTHPSFIFFRVSALNPCLHAPERPGSSKLC